METLPLAQAFFIKDKQAEEAPLKLTEMVYTWSYLL
jgi:hypothetical protein